MSVFNWIMSASPQRADSQDGGAVGPVLTRPGHLWVRAHKCQQLCFAKKASTSQKRLVEVQFRFRELFHHADAINHATK
jgi:hypothetical protein